MIQKDSITCGVLAREHRKALRGKTSRHTLHKRECDHMHARYSYLSTCVCVYRKYIVCITHTIHIYIYMCVCIHTYIHIYIYTYIHIQLYTYIHICIYAYNIYIYRHTHVFMHACMHACMHVCRCICVLTRCRQASGRSTTEARTHCSGCRLGRGFRLEGRGFRVYI